MDENGSTATTETSATNTQQSDTGADAGSNGAGTSPTSTTPSFADLIPADLKSKEIYQNLLKNEKPAEAFFNHFEHLNKQVGAKQYNIPDEKTAPEQKTAWLKALGVPESADQYNIPEIQWEDDHKASAEFLKSTRNDKFLESVKADALKAGVPLKMFEAMAESYERNFVNEHSAQLKALIEEEERINTEFHANAAKMFGDRKEEVLENAAKLIQKYSKDFAPNLREADNTTLLGLIEVIDGITKEYISEDALRGLKGSTASSDMSTSEGIHAKIKELRATKEFSEGERNPGFNAKKQEIDRLYGELSKARTREGKLGS